MSNETHKQIVSLNQFEEKIAESSTTDFYVRCGSFSLRADLSF